MLDKYWDVYKDDAEFIAEGLALSITEQALTIMKAQDISKSELARRMSVSRPQVSRLFKAAPNLTLVSVARLASALNMDVIIILKDKTENDTENQVECI